MERYGRKKYKRRAHIHRGRRVLPLLFCLMLLTAGFLTAQKFLPSAAESLLVIRDKDAERIFLPVKTTETAETDAETERVAVQESENAPVETMISVETEAEANAPEIEPEPDTVVGLRQRIPADYDYASPVPAADAVTIDYMNDAVLIGDSRMQGLILYCGLSRITSYTYKGLTVDSVFTKPVIDWEEAADLPEDKKIPADLWSDGKVPVMSALSQTEFNKVYIMLGINETGWPDAVYFADAYGTVIDAIRETNPDCLIYMLSIFPVTKAVSDTHDYVTNEKIALYNEYLQQLAFEKEVFLVDLAPAVVDENGVLPADSGVDGIHLNKDYCVKVLDHILAHTVPLLPEGE